MKGSGRKGPVVWVVRAGDPDTVGALVLRAGGDDAAVREGRVFVGRRRAGSDSEPVKPGDSVRIAPKVELRLDEPVRILARHGGVLAVSKPSGLPTIADQAGKEETLLAHVARLEGLPEDRLHTTSRLDRLVSGVVLVAMDADARDLLRVAREEGRYERRYVALARRTDARGGDTLRVGMEGVWDAPIGRAADPRLRAIGGRDATAATTLFRVVDGTETAWLLALAPVTGRTHQLRLHASHAGHPLFGDVAYGGPANVVLEGGRVLALPRVALHAARVHVHGRSGTDPGAFGPGPRDTLAIEAPVPSRLQEFWRGLGGAADAWNRAVACELPPFPRTSHGDPAPSASARVRPSR
ncbi:MAG: RluA family pseudouridine synthase [Polyangiaceae bacterium]